MLVMLSCFQSYLFILDIWLNNVLSDYLFYVNYLCVFVVIDQLLPSKQRTWPCAGSMLAHRLRRWANIEQTHGHCPLFAG